MVFAIVPRRLTLAGPFAAGSLTRCLPGGNIAGFLEAKYDKMRNEIMMVSAEEVTLFGVFNSLQWLTCHSGTIEPQKLFHAVANRNSHLKFTN